MDSNSTSYKGSEKEVRLWLGHDSSQICPPNPQPSSSTAEWSARSTSSGGRCTRRASSGPSPTSPRLNAAPTEVRATLAISVPQPLSSVCQLVWLPTIGVLPVDNHPPHHQLVVRLVVGQTPTRIWPWQSHVPYSLVSGYLGAQEKSFSITAWGMWRDSSLDCPLPCS